MRCQSVSLAVLAAMLAACANITPPSQSPVAEGVSSGTERHPVAPDPSLLEWSDSRIAIALDAVVVPNGPGAWTRDAHWDEYRFRMRSAGGDPLRVARISLVDAENRRIASSATRRELAGATDQYGYLKSIAGDVALTAFATVAVTAAAFVPGVGYLAAQALGRMVGTNLRVDAVLKRKQTPLPAPVGADDTSVVAFFPVVQPSAIEIVYLDGNEERYARIVAQPFLSRVHDLVDHRPNVQFPSQAVRHGIEEGHVKGRLTIDANGAVVRVDIVKSSSPVFLEESRSVFAKYKYPPGSDGRTADEQVSFKRPGSKRSSQDGK